MLDWQDRSRRLIGDEGVRRLASARVLLIGLGGVGSFCAEALGRSGVGAMTIIDCDTIDPTNINRQLPALTDTIDREKTEVVADRLKRINPDLRLSARFIKITAENIDQTLDDPDEKPDFIADAIDDIPAKVAIAIAAKRRGIELIASMGAGFRLDPSLLQISDISRTHTCPLAKRYRRALKDLGLSEGIPVVWSREKPIRLNEGGAGDIGDAGDAGDIGDVSDAGDAGDIGDVSDAGGTGGASDIGDAGDASDMSGTGDIGDVSDTGGTGGASYAGGTGDTFSSKEPSRSGRGPASMVFAPAAAGLLMASYIVRRIISPDTVDIAKDRSCD